MDLVGFSEEILTVHDAISQICSKFPNTYWEEHGQKEQDPKEFHAAKEGWLYFLFQIWSRMPVKCLT